jgi:hypothetical protein
MESPDVDDGETEDINTNSDDDNEEVVQSQPPSHILEDGRFIYLPPPSTVERCRFFERSVARHGLLEADMMGKSKDHKPDNSRDKMDDEDEDIGEAKDETTTTTPKVHPLAVASARLQANGLAELNRAINLAGLVNKGEYFGLTTVVDPSLEVGGGDAGSGTTKDQGGSGVGKKSTGASSSLDMLEEQKVKSLYILKRKRLKAAIEAQSVIDQRLLELRQQWRLVAPEHGTRARLHAARPTEVVAVDVDVYDRDRVGGGNQALLGKRPTLAGRLASRVPRYATIALKDHYKVDLEGLERKEKKRQREREEKEYGVKKDDDDDDDDTDDPMDVGDEAKKGETRASKKKEKDTDGWTRAEPFAVADPTSGKVNENFDPDKVPMLTLKLEIQKSSTGFKQSACLSPMTTLSAAQDATVTYAVDEQVLVSLQHSLFCASLFESIRSELDPNEKSQASATTKTQLVAWLSCESEENFLPPPSVLAGGDLSCGLASLSVVHCHEGELKVQLDAEYTLCVKLVEADSTLSESIPDGSSSTGTLAGNENSTTINNSTNKSGSQSPSQLHALCRALLLHAQDVYHNHSLYLRAHAKKKAEEEAAKGDQPRGLARIKKEDVVQGPRILQSCVSLGSKMLFEKRVRASLVVGTMMDFR